MKQSTIFDDIIIDVAKDTDKLLLNKIKNPLKPNVSRSVVEVYEEVRGVFAQVKALVTYVDDFELITTKERLQTYLTKIKENGLVAIDTETDGLDPISDRIAGFSIYTRGENPAYIPLNHDYYNDNVSIKMASSFMQAIKDSKVRVVMHNARFDIRVIKNWLGVRLPCYVDTLIAAKLLNENEDDNSLKALWTKYILRNKAQYFKYNDLFSGIKFTVFDPTRVYVYAALDALMTYDLFEFQEPFFDKANPKCIAQDLQETSDLLFTIEMPIIDVAVDMEERGVSIDAKYASDLKDKYMKMADEIEAEAQKELAKLMPKIRSNLSSKELSELSNPINLKAPAQLKVIFYSGLQIKIPKGKLKKKKEFSTDKDVVGYIVENIPEYSAFAKKLLDYKALQTIISTFLVAIPKRVNPKTNRLHTSWITIGADTGRFSSREPNLQNIPSKNKEIRPMFVPKDGYAFVGADYAAQEPRLMADISQDPVLIKNYLDDRDLYSTLASMAYGLPYDSCTKATKEGKVKRDHGKKLQLALSYGMREKSLAVELGISEDEAKILYRSFVENLSVAFQYGDELRRQCKRDGYVKTLWGRKRRFPDYLLQDVIVDGAIPNDKKRILAQRVRRAWKDRREVIASIEAEYNVVITDNMKKIRDCETQIVNSVMQGSAADMTKAALILVSNDSEMIRMDARPVLAVHDEIIVECPKEYAKEVEVRLADLMVQAAGQRVKSVPFRAEGEVMERWHKD